MYLIWAELPCTKIDFCQRFVYILAAFRAVSFARFTHKGCQAEERIGGRKKSMTAPELTRAK
jgi:hypothetical protein